jgi:hypothetical protein
MVDEERKIEILWERTGCLDMWMFEDVTRDSSTSGEVALGLSSMRVLEAEIVAISVVIVLILGV